MGVKRLRGNGGKVMRYNPYAGAIGAAARLAMRYKYRGSGSRTATRNSRNRDYGNITFQNDEHMIYRRKRAPKGLRKKHRRAFKNFMYNLDKLQSMKTCVIVNSSAQTLVPASLAVSQIAFGVTLYGYAPNTYAANIAPGNGDIPWIFARENGAYPTADLASRKLRFRSAVMDLTVYNALVGNEENAYGGILCLDVYHVLARKDVYNATLGADPVLWWSDAVREQAAGNMPTAITSYQFDGVTPFDAPGFGRNWIIKRVRKVRLSPGQTFITQLRDPGNYTLNMYDVLEQTVGSNLTEGYIIVGYNPATNPVTGFRGAVAMNHNYRKKYHYTETSSSIDSIGN